MEREYNAEKEFDDLAEEYEENLKELLGRWGAGDEKFAEYKVQLLREILPKGGIQSILDFGCGTGRSLRYFNEYFCGQTSGGERVSLFGCDVSEESLRLAAEALPDAVLFQSTSVDSLGKQGVKFDLVFIACVLHHIEPTERAMWMKAIAENVSDGGVICVFEHNLINPYTKKIVKDPKNRVDRVEFMLTQKKLVSLLTNAHADMRLYWKGYTLFSPWRWKGITAFEKHLGWCPLGAQQCVIVRKDVKN